MRKNIAIHKFGGTSLGDAGRIRNAALLLAAARRRGRVVAVASAMGGVPDVLLGAAREAERGRIGPARAAVEALRERHEAAARSLGVRRGPCSASSPPSRGRRALRERTARHGPVSSSARLGAALAATLVKSAFRARRGRPRCS